MERKNTKRGQVWICDFTGNTGSEQSGVRPCIVLNQQKFYENTCIVLICSNTVRFSTLEKNGYKFLLHQVRTIDTSRLKRELERFTKKDTDLVVQRFTNFLQ